MAKNITYGRPLPYCTSTFIWESRVQGMAYGQVSVLHFRMMSLLLLLCTVPRLAHDCKNLLKNRLAQSLSKDLHRLEALTPQITKVKVWLMDKLVRCTLE